MIGAALLIVWTGLVLLIVVRAGRVVLAQRLPALTVPLCARDSLGRRRNCAARTAPASSAFAYGPCSLHLRWIASPTFTCRRLSSSPSLVAVSRTQRDSRALRLWRPWRRSASLCTLTFSSRPERARSTDPSHRANGIALIILHGKERMFVCLGVCTLDVTANAVIIYLVTMPRREATTALAAVGPVPRAATTAAAVGSRPLRDCKGGGVGAKQQRRWSWRRPPSSSATSRRRTDLSSISVRIDEEVAFDYHDSPEIESTCRLPRPPERIKTAASTRSFVREAGASSNSSAGSRWSAASSGEGAEESCSDREPKADVPRRSSMC